MEYDVFISYSRKDLDEVTRIKELIECSLPNLKIWFDYNGIESGDEFADKIASAIDRSSFVLFMMSPNSINSKWTKNEITYAQAKSKRVIPLLLRDGKLDGWFLLQFGVIDCIDSADGRQMEKLLRNLSDWCNINRAKSEVAVKEEIKPIMKTDFPENWESGGLDAETQFNLGLKYEKENNDEKAIYWYKKAAEQGLSVAQFNLAVKYDKEKDYIQAVFWYRKAAEQGIAIAQYNLANCFAKGQGVAIDEKQAIEWFGKAAEQNYALAQYNIGVCYHEGRGVQLNIDTAMKWFKKAAEQGYAPAQYQLGLGYYEGKGVKQDTTMAIDWFNKAAEQGEVRSQYNLGVFYANAKGVAKDDALSASWFRKAAEQGYAPAQCNLGILYEFGRGVPCDKDQAIFWHIKAAEQGYKNSKIILNHLLTDGNTQA